MTGIDNAFTILQIEKTTDKKAIRQAYAKLVNNCHPEEHPDEWLRLHNAYETALEWARRKEQREKTAKVVQIENENLGPIKRVIDNREEDYFEHMDELTAEARRMRVEQEQQQTDLYMNMALDELQRMLKHLSNWRVKHQIRDDWEKFFWKEEYANVIIQDCFLYRFADMVGHVLINRKWHDYFSVILQNIKEIRKGVGIEQKKNGMPDAVETLQRSLDISYQKFSKSLEGKVQSFVCAGFHISLKKGIIIILAVMGCIFWFFLWALVPVNRSAEPEAITGQEEQAEGETAEEILTEESAENESSREGNNREGQNQVRKQSLFLEIGLDRVMRKLQTEDREFCKEYLQLMIYDLRLRESIQSVDMEEWMEEAMYVESGTFISCSGVRGSSLDMYIYTINGEVIPEKVLSQIQNEHPNAEMQILYYYSKTSPGHYVLWMKDRIWKLNEGGKLYACYGDQCIEIPEYTSQKDTGWYRYPVGDDCQIIAVPVNGEHSKSVKLIRVLE